MKIDKSRVLVPGAVFRSEGNFLLLRIDVVWSSVETLGIHTLIGTLAWIAVVMRRTCGIVS